MTWIPTYTGHHFDIFDPDPAKIHIEDIAHHLSLINRFNGATLFPYSVAQHSLMVSSLCPQEYKLAGLMHDAAEAYVGDFPAPWRSRLWVRWMERSYYLQEQKFDELEPAICDAICGALGTDVWIRSCLSMTASPIVHEADQRALATERRDIMAGGGRWPTDGKFKPSDEVIKERHFRDVEQEFLMRYKELTQ